MLISELLKAKKNIFQIDHSVLTVNSFANAASKHMAKFSNDEDEEEKFVDVKSQSDDEESGQDVKPKSANSIKDDKNANASTSWMHKKNVIFKRHEKYDINERNPLYCGADKTLTYELLPFTRHYHPTVVVFANQLLNVIILFF